jgi:hypothetical protein
MKYPIKNNIPLEEIQNGALILLLLRECKPGKSCVEDMLTPIPRNS